LLFSLTLIKVSWLSDDGNELFDQLKVVSLVEVDESGLPELLGVDRGPGELASLDLLLPLLEGRELSVVLVEEFEKSLKSRNDILVNPRAVLELHDNVKSINHG
jgi:hypothetical protein